MTEAANRRHVESRQDAAHLVAQAQVHATLAMTSATALEAGVQEGGIRYRDWHEVAS